MKLLIVDDEKLTREGIRDSLGLESLGISQVLLEDDGIHGLKTALEERPDIVLTDVRMPRMNGVQMAERILKELPGTSIIFMSAYSDKEYLKAAIKLKALGYVEKPLDMEELASAVKEAVDSSRNEKISQAAARLQEKEQPGPSEPPAVPARGGKSYKGRTAWRRTWVFLSPIPPASAALSLTVSLPYPHCRRNRWTESGIILWSISHPWTYPRPMC